MRKKALLFLIFSTLSFITAYPHTYNINSKDTVLIVSPHPDDAILSCAGIIQESLRHKAKVYVLYITSGEHNILSIIYYKKSLLLEDKKEYKGR